MPRGAARAKMGYSGDEAARIIIRWSHENLRTQHSPGGTRLVDSSLDLARRPAALRVRLPRRPAGAGISGRKAQGHRLLLLLLLRPGGGRTRGPAPVLPTRGPGAPPGQLETGHLRSGPRRPPRAAGGRVTERL